MTHLCGPLLIITVFTFLLQLSGIYLSLLSGNSIHLGEESGSSTPPSSNVSTFGLFSQQVLYSSNSVFDASNASTRSGSAGVLVVNVGLTTTCKAFIASSEEDEDGSSSSGSIAGSLDPFKESRVQCTSDVFDWSDSRCSFGTRGDSRSGSESPSTFKGTDTNLLYSAQALIVVSVTLNAVILFSFCGILRGYGFRCFLALLNFFAMGGATALLYFLSSRSWGPGATCPSLRGLCGVPTTCSFNFSLGYWVLSSSGVVSVFIFILFLTTIPSTSSTATRLENNRTVRSSNEPFHHTEEPREADDVNSTVVLDMDEMRIMLQEHRKDLIGEFRRRGREIHSTQQLRVPPPPKYEGSPSDVHIVAIPAPTSGNEDHFDKDLELTSPTFEDHQ